MTWESTWVSEACQVLLVRGWPVRRQRRAGPAPAAASSTLETQHQDEADTAEGQEAVRYHRRFRNIRPEELKVTEGFFRGGPWRGSDDERQTLYERWARLSAQVYDIPPPLLELRLGSPEPIHGPGTYEMGTLVLYRWSVITLFHEFRHHMQFLGIGPFEDAIAREDDARAWSCSLFYSVRPVAFRKAVRQGRILFMTAEDLTRSTHE